MDFNWMVIGRQQPRDIDKIVDVQPKE